MAVMMPAGVTGRDVAQRLFPTSLVTVIVAIDSADENNGATEVFRGKTATFFR